MKNKLGLILTASGIAIRCGAAQLNKVKVKTTGTTKQRKTDKLFDIDVKPYLTDEEITKLRDLGVQVTPIDYSLRYPDEVAEKLGGSIPVTYKMRVSYRIKKKVFEVVGNGLVVAGLLLTLIK